VLVYYTKATIHLPHTAISVSASKKALFRCCCHSLCCFYSFCNLSNVDMTDMSLVTYPKQRC